MNARQRRSDSRRRHMELPLSKPVVLAALHGRTVYSYEVGRKYLLDAETMEMVAGATVQRHIFPGRRLDLLLESRDGKQSSICISLRGIRLKDKAERAVRPWWSELRRRNRRTAR